MKHLLNLGKNHTIFYHLLGWIIFIIYEVSFVKMIRWSSVDVSIWSGYIIPYLLNISLFYFHALVIMNACFGGKPKKVLLFLIMVLLELFIYLFLMNLKDSGYAESEKNFLNYLAPSKVILVQYLWRGIYFLIFSTAFWLINRSFKREKMLKEAETNILLKQQEKQELEIKLISAQNAFLQSQINPHFLFNTLNFIHSEVQQVSEKASEAIITLSDMMRYSLAETKSDGKVELERELEQIENLIRINQFRFNSHLCLELNTSGDFAQHRIFPLLLIPFVENIFKYADLTDKEHRGKINMQVKDDVLYFETFNKKRKATGFRSTGIGINNVKTRLNSYYPNRYSLQIDDSSSTYSVHLTIEL